MKNILAAVAAVAVSAVVVHIDKVVGDSVSFTAHTILYVTIVIMLTQIDIRAEYRKDRLVDSITQLNKATKFKGE